MKTTFYHNWQSSKSQPRSCRLFACLFTISLCACEPGVGISWQKDFDGPIDVSCIQSALSKVVPRVSGSRFVSNGHDDIPAGLVVTQFNYGDPTSNEAYDLEIARLPDGKTRVRHAWGKFGTRIEKTERQTAGAMLNRVNGAISRQCKISFAGALFKEG